MIKQNTYKVKHNKRVWYDKTRLELLCNDIITMGVYEIVNTSVIFLITIHRAFDILKLYDMDVKIACKEFGIEASTLQDCKDNHIHNWKIRNYPTDYQIGLLRHLYIKATELLDTL